MTRIFNYFNFLFKSQSTKKISNTFIQDFIQKGLKVRSKQKSSVSNEVFFKTVAYIKPQKVNVFDKSDQLKNVLSSFALDIKFGKEDAELFYFNKKLKDNELERFLLSNIFHENSIVIIKDIRGSKIAKKSWKNMLKSEKVTYTLDLYHTGILFFKKSKDKENFMIRA